MKKITLMIFAMVLSIASYAQTLLTQSLDPVNVSESGVACWSSPTTGGDGSYSNNSFFRAYVLNDFGITGSFAISEVQYGQGSADDGKLINLNIYTADTDDLTVATLTLIATTTHVSSAADDLSLVTVPMIAVIPAGSIVVFEVNAPDSLGMPDQTYFPGSNTAGENDESYLMAADCLITVPTPVGQVATAEQYVMNVLGDELLSVGENLAQMVSVYPNPASTVLNISLPSNVEVINATLTDMLGRTTGVVYSNGEMNVSGLSQGVYFLNLETNFGSYTQKIVKQ